MVKRVWRGPTPFLRLKEEGNLVIPEVPMIFLHVRRSDRDQKPRWLHTNWAGRICRFTRVDDAQRPKKGKKYERFGTHVPFNPRAEYEGWLCGEIFFDRDQLDDDQMETLTTEVKEGRLYIDWEAPQPRFRSFESTLLKFLTKGSLPSRLEELSEALGAGVTADDYEEYQKLLASLLTDRLINRYISDHPKVGSRELCNSSVGLPEPRLHNPSWLHWTDEDQNTLAWVPRGPGLRHELRNGFVYTGTSDLSNAQTDPETGRPRNTGSEDQNIKNRTQLWKLGAKVKPRPGLGYDPTHHSALAWDLTERLQIGARQRAAQRKISEAEAATQILTDPSIPGDGTWANDFLLAPGLNPGDSVARTDAGALARAILVGQSENSFDAALAQALSQMDAQTRTQSSSFDHTRKGKPTEIKWHKVKRPLATMMFTFATGHWIYDFQLVHIKRRVQAWWQTLPRDVRKRLNGGAIQVDAWASQLGDASFNKWLSDHRLTEVMTPLQDLLDTDGITDVEITQHSHGEAAQPSVPAGEILKAVEVFETTRVYDAMITANEENPWQHRVVTVQLFENVEVPAAGESQVLSHQVLTEMSYPLYRATVLGGAATPRTPGKIGRWHHWVWVLITPGEEIEPNREAPTTP